MMSKIVMRLSRMIEWHSSVAAGCARLLLAVVSRPVGSLGLVEEAGFGVSAARSVVERRTDTRARCVA